MGQAGRRGGQGAFQGECRAGEVRYGDGLCADESAGLAVPVSPPACPTDACFAHRPMLIDMNKVYGQTNLENLDQAFSVAERDLGVTRLLDPEGGCRCPSSRPSPAACVGPSDL